MRAEDEARIFDQSLTKKKAAEYGKTLVADILERGEENPVEVAAKLARLNEVVSSALAAIKEKLPAENLKAFGVEFSHVAGGETVDFEEDEIYRQLVADVEARKELLKLAQKQSVFDAYGNPVPKVGTKPRKSYLTLKF